MNNIGLFSLQLAFQSYYSYRHVASLSWIVLLMILYVIRILPGSLRQIPSIHIAWPMHATCELICMCSCAMFCITAGRSCGQPGGGWLKHSLMTLCTAQKAHPLKCRATHTGWLTTWIRVMNISLKFLRYCIVVFF